MNLAEKKENNWTESLYTMPSVFFLDGLRMLKLENEHKRLEKAYKLADHLQMKHTPGRPSITMAAVLWKFLPRIRCRRGMAEVARAFECSPKALTARIRLLSRKGWE